MNFETVKDIIIDSLLDSAALFPFLLITYILLEYWERRNEGKSLNLISSAGKSGPIAGALCGLIPQCGFAAAASNFYAARAISIGTLMAVYLSTSDEMLPILISNAVGTKVILKILGLKLLYGIGIGIICDFIMSRKPQNLDIEPLCEEAECHCAGGGIIKPALYHAVKITIFVLAVTMVLNALMEIYGAKLHDDIVFRRPIVGPIIAAAIGIIPNCSASVAVTQMWVEGVMNAASLMSGLLAGGGVGLLVLFRINRNRRENIKIAVILYVSAVICGILTEFLSVNL